MAQENIYNIATFDSEGYADTLPDGWRILHVITGNAMDECYIDLPEMGEDETEEAIRDALRSKYGRRYSYVGYEDVTELYRATC